MAYDPLPVTLHVLPRLSSRFALNGFRSRFKTFR